MADIESQENKYQELMEGVYHDALVEYATEAAPQTYAFQALKIMEISHYIFNTAQNSPCPRALHQLAVNDGQLFVIGGRNLYVTMATAFAQRTPLFEQVFVLNLATRKWTMESAGRRTMPYDIPTHVLLREENKVTAYMEQNILFGRAANPANYELRQFTLGAYLKIDNFVINGVLPPYYYGCEAITIANKLYHISHEVSDASKSAVYCLDMQRHELRWEELQVLDEVKPMPRCFHKLISDGGFIYMLGGSHRNLLRNQCDLKNMPRFNISSCEWTYVTTLGDAAVTANDGYPEPREQFSCVERKNAQGELECFIAGGRNAVGLQDVWCLNLKEMTWICIHSAVLPYEVHAHAAAVTASGCMYVFGGRERRSEETAVHPSGRLMKMWLTIPKLSEICWEAVQFYDKNLIEKGRDQLLGDGIPLRFVERLEANVEYKPNAKQNSSQ